MPILNHTVNVPLSEITRKNCFKKLKNYRNAKKLLDLTKNLKRDNETLNKPNDFTEKFVLYSNFQHHMMRRFREKLTKIELKMNKAKMGMMRKLRILWYGYIMNIVVKEKFKKSFAQASDSPEVTPAGAADAASISSSNMGTIRLSRVISLYLVTKTVNRRHRCVSASNFSNIWRWWK